MARFRKGQSGNPAGRPKGIPDKRTVLRSLLAPHAEELVAKARELALRGDTTALRLCLERLIPPFKSVEEWSPVDGFGEGETVEDRTEWIVSAVVEGQISPRQAVNLIQVLVTQAELGKIALLDQRIEELERRNA